MEKAVLEQLLNLVALAFAKERKPVLNVGITEDFVQ